MRAVRNRLEKLLTTELFTYPELRKMFLTPLLLRMRGDHWLHVKSAKA